MIGGRACIYWIAVMQETGGVRRPDLLQHSALLQVIYVRLDLLAWKASKGGKAATQNK